MASEILPQLALERRNQMHHVRVALHIHEIFYLHRAIFAHASQVVAAQVHQHHVLGALFLVVAHLFFEAQIFGLVVAAGMRPGNRAVLELAPGHANQHLWRRAQNLRLRHAKKINIGRRIYLPQRAIEIERRNAWNEVEPLREHNLENIARCNVLLASLYAAHEISSAVVPVLIFNFSAFGFADFRQIAGRNPHANFFSNIAMSRTARS